MRWNVVDASAHRRNRIPRNGDLKISLYRWTTHSRESLKLKRLPLVGGLFQWQWWESDLLFTAKHLFDTRTARDRSPDRECAVHTTGVIWITFIFVKRNTTAHAAKPIMHQFVQRNSLQELSRHSNSVYLYPVRRAWYLCIMYPWVPTLSSAERHSEWQTKIWTGEVTKYDWK